MKIISCKNSKIEIGKSFVDKDFILDGFIISDSNLHGLYPNLFGNNFYVIKSGEINKSLESYCDIVKSLDNVEKIVAFGGGVVGDLAGLVASTYKRGVSFIQIPTTLLAMVDSSLGGKNGINLGNKKNFLGTIYQPESVLIDTSFLQTLPKKEFRNGLSEIIKYSYLFSRPRLERLFKRISFEDSDLEEIIFDCCNNKVDVIEVDEMDRDYRHVLNFGHTIGHAIELLYNLSHGEAISIGMVKELELGERLGIVSKNDFDRVKDLLLVNDLPTQFPSYFNFGDILEVMKYDKKGKFVFAFNRYNYNVCVNEKFFADFLQS